MGAEDGVAAPVGDELAEAVGTAVCHRPDKILLPCGSHGDVVQRGTACYCDQGLPLLIIRYTGVRAEPAIADR